MKLEFSIRAILGTALALALLMTLPVGASPPDRLTPALSSGDAYLVDADLRKEGQSLVAWASPSDRISAISVYQGDRLSHRVEIDGYLVKSVQWTEPGRTFWTSGIVPKEGEQHGSGEDRLYALSPTGKVEAQWTTGGIEEELGPVSLARDGKHWIASELGADTARVTVGALGDDTPLAAWTVVRGDGRAERDTTTGSAFLLGDRLADGVGILWRGDFWLAELDEPEPQPLDTPEGCLEIQKVDAVAGTTLWVQCYRGLEADPSHQWLRYRGDLVLAVAGKAPDLVTSEFSQPTFRDDGSIIDWRRPGSQVWLLTPDATGDDYVSEGLVELPVDETGNRVVLGGELMLEQRGTGQEYRVWDMDAVIATHRARRAADGDS